MKKIYSLFLLLFVLLSSLSAVDRSGRANTVEEAERQALAHLREYFFGNYESLVKKKEANKYEISETYGKIYYYDKNVVEHTGPEVKNGKFSVRCSVDEDDMNIYFSHIETLRGRIAQLYEKAYNAPQYYDGRVEDLESLLNDLIDYEDSIQIVMAVCPERTDLPWLDFDLKSEYVHIKLENALITEESLLRDRITKTAKLAEQQEIRMRMVANSNRQKQLDKNYNAARAIKNQKRIENYLLYIRDIKKTSPLPISGKTYEYNQIKDRIRTLNETEEEFVAAEAILMDYRDAEFNRIGIEIDEMQRAVSERPFRRSELKDGSPTQAAERYKERKAEEVSKSKEKERSENYAIIVKIGTSILQPIFDKYMKIIFDMENAVAVSPIEQTSFVVQNVVFDNEYHTYLVQFSDGQYNFDINVRYKDIAHREPVREGRPGYESYLRSQENYSNRLRNIADNYGVELRFSLDAVYIESCIYYQLADVIIKEKNGDIISCNINAPSMKFSNIKIIYPSFEDCVNIGSSADFEYKNLPIISAVFGVQENEYKKAISTSLAEKFSYMSESEIDELSRIDSSILSKIIEGEFVYVKYNDSKLAILSHEVTQSEYEAVMGVNPSSFKGAKMPVERVSWYDAVNYCNTLSLNEGLQACYAINGNDVRCDFTRNGYRLLTVDEWIYASAGGENSGEYIYSGSSNIADVAWYDVNSAKQSHPVRTKKANEIGLYDMSGNLWEWCWDYVLSKRAVCGGSWISNQDSCRFNSQETRGPTAKSHNIGFRIARAV